MPDLMQSEELINILLQDKRILSAKKQNIICLIQNYWTLIYYKKRLPYFFLTNPFSHFAKQYLHPDLHAVLPENSSRIVC